MVTTESADPLSELVLMGFDYEQAVKALRAMNNDVARAAEFLISQQPTLYAAATATAPSAQPLSVSLSAPTTAAQRHHPHQQSSAPKPALSVSQTVFHGYVLSTFPEKGFGFLQPHSQLLTGDKTIFYHQSNVTNDQLLSKDDEVSFEIEYNHKKRSNQAVIVNVVRFRDPNVKGVQWSRAKASHHRSPNHSQHRHSNHDDESREYCGTGQHNGQPSITEFHLASLPSLGFIVSISSDYRSGRVYLSSTKSPLSRSRILDFTSYELSSQFIRSLSSGDRVSFYVAKSNVQECGYEVRDMMLINKHCLTSSLQHSQLQSQQLPLASLNVCRSTEALFVLNCEMKHDETRHVEFKSLARSKNLERRIRELTEKYTSSFLNSSGGWLYCGVSDRGVVEGLLIDQRQRDELRRAIDTTMSHMSPRVDTRLYTVNFHPCLSVIHVPNILLSHAVNSSMIPNEFVVDERQSTAFYCVVDNLFVVSTAVQPPRTNEVYFTSADYHSDGQKHAYMRRDGSTREMDAAMVAERNKITQSERDERIKQEILSQVMADVRRSQLMASQSQSFSLSPSTTPTSSQSSSRPSPTFAQSIRDQFLSMDIDRMLVLDAIYQLEKDGKLIDSASDREKERVIAEMFDRIEAAQNTRQQSTNHTNMSIGANGIPVLPPIQPTAVKVEREVLMIDDDTTDGMMEDDDNHVPCEYCGALVQFQSIEMHERQCRSQKRQQSQSQPQSQSLSSPLGFLPS